MHRYSTATGIRTRALPDTRRLTLGVAWRITAHMSRRMWASIAVILLLAGGCSDRRRIEATPSPQRVATGSVGAASVGRLLRIRGRLVSNVVDDQPYGWKLYVDDGSGQALVFIATDTAIDVSRWQRGQEIVVTGIGGQYGDHYELLPRMQSDLQLVSPPAVSGTPR